MTFNFDSVLAKKFGVNEAIFIHNIFFWISHNEANNKHYYEGRFWTYNTKKAFAELFPFWTYEQVKKIIQKLSKEEVLLRGYFHENTWDRTTWYSLSNEVVNFYKNASNPNKTALLEKQQCIVEKATIHCGKSNNPLLEKQQSLIGTDNKPYNKTQIQGALGFFENEFPSEFEILMMQFKSRIDDYVSFSEFFEAAVEQEGLAYELHVLSGRFKKFALNWIKNRNKFDGKVISMVGTNNENKLKIGGGF